MALLGRITKRREFLAARNGRRVHREAFVLQKISRTDDVVNTGSANFGYTVTRKTGNSVVRNRIRRRLREAVRLVAAEHVMAGDRYVLIGKRAALHHSFERLKNDLIYGLDRLTARSSISDRHSENPTGAANKSARSGKTFEK